jgi:hypothetical protein
MSTFNYKYQNYTKIVAENSELTHVDQGSTDNAAIALEHELRKDDLNSENEKSTNLDLENVSASNINEQLSVTVTLDEYSKYLTEVMVFINDNGLLVLAELMNRLNKSTYTKAANIFGRNDEQIKNDMIIRIIIATLAINHVKSAEPMSFTIPNLELDDGSKAALLKEAEAYLQIIKSNSNDDFTNSDLVPFNIAVLPQTNWTSIEYKKILNAERANMGSFAALGTSYFIPLFLLKSIVDTIEKAVDLFMQHQDIIPLAYIRSINFVALMLKGALNKRGQKECVRITSLLDEGKYKLTFDENNLVNPDECDTKFPGTWNLLSRTRCRSLARSRNKISSKYNKNVCRKHQEAEERKGDHQDEKNVRARHVRTV